MTTRRPSEEFWAKVERLSRKPGWRRCVTLVRDHYWQRGHGGEPIAALDDPELLKKVVGKVCAEVEYVLAQEQLRRVEGSLAQATRQFWDASLDHLGLSSADDLDADLRTMAIVRRPERKGQPPSLGKAAAGFRGLVQEALTSPLAALRMSQDPVLPNWLRKLGALVADTGTRPLSPALRELVDSWVERPAEARAFIDGGGARGEPELAFLEPLARVLALHRRWHRDDLPADDTN